MKQALTTAIAVLALGGALAGCDREGTATHSSTTVVKEPTVVQKDRETTVVQKDAPAAPAATPAPSSSSTNVTVDAGKTEVKPEATESSKSTTTSRVDTPMGTATKTETTRTETSK